MKIYTRTGDQGTTGLMGNHRLSKDAPRIQAIGEVDELNAAIGLAMAIQENGSESPDLRWIQGKLFEFGAELASPGDSRFQSISQHDTERLEKSIDTQTAGLPELRSFILPGGAESAARLHFARAICRRAERAVIGLHQSEPLRIELIVFVNRLADWLFVAARTANANVNVLDVEWNRGN
jgi:cob(I)alamin adenosyltransferase